MTRRKKRDETDGVWWYVLLWTVLLLAVYGLGSMTYDIARAARKDDTFTAQPRATQLYTWVVFNNSRQTKCVWDDVQMRWVQIPPFESISFNTTTKARPEIGVCFP